LKNLIDAGYGIIAEEINESESYIETREQLHEWMGLM
jgi:hypothetical protein